MKKKSRKKQKKLLSVVLLNVAHNQGQFLTKWQGGVNRQVMGTVLCICCNRKCLSCRVMFMFVLVFVVCVFLSQ